MAILKPDKCRGCPFYDKSKYITPDKMVKGSSILILAQNPGESEELGKEIVKTYFSRGKKEYEYKDVVPQPLIGATGDWLKREFWPLTKIPYEGVSRANIIKCRPNSVNELPAIGSNKAVNGITAKMLKEAIRHCTSHYLKIPSSIKYIMAMGSISLYHLTGEIKIQTEDQEGNIKYKKEGITDWRGSVIGTDLLGTFYGIKEYYEVSPLELNIFPVLHIASLFQSEKYYHATLNDFSRFGKLVRREWPEKIPEIKINFIPKSIPETIGFDTEYDIRDGNRLIMWSMADIKHNVYVVDASHSHRLENLPSKLNLITQNGLVDLPHFLPLVSSTDLTKINMEDCMLANAVLWTGEPNSLDYILSRVGRYNRHKHLRSVKDKYQDYLYAGLDADTTLNHAWYSMVQEFKKDPLSYQEYKKRRQPLLFIINKFQSKGVEIWKERVSLIGDIFDKEMEAIVRHAKEVTGNPTFNIAAWQQVSKGVYENSFTSEKPVKINRDKQQKLGQDVAKVRKGKRKSLVEKIALLEEKLGLL